MKTDVSISNTMHNVKYAINTNDTNVSDLKKDENKLD